MCVSYKPGPGKVYQYSKDRIVTCIGLRPNKAKWRKGLQEEQIHTVSPLSKPRRTATFSPTLTLKQVSLRHSSFTINTPPIRLPSQPRLFRHVLTLFISSYITEEDSIILSSPTPFDPSHTHTARHTFHIGPLERYHCETEALGD